MSCMYFMYCYITLTGQDVPRGRLVPPIVQLWPKGSPVYKKTGLAKYRTIFALRNRDTVCKRVKH